jgi:hypothetical protein
MTQLQTWTLFKRMKISVQWATCKQPKKRKENPQHHLQSIRKIKQNSSRLHYKVKWWLKIRQTIFTQFWQTGDIGRQNAYTIGLIKLEPVQQHWLRSEAKGCKLAAYKYMRSTIFWDVMLYSLVEVDQRFGVTYCLHIQSWRARRASRQCSACLVYSLTLKTEAVYSSKILVNFYETIWYHISDGFFIVTTIRTSNLA